VKSALAVALALLVSIGSAQGRADAIADATYSILERRMDQLFHAGLYEECLSVLKVMQGMDPSEPELSNLVAWMNGNLGRFDEELSELLRFHAAYPDVELAAYQLGQALMAKKLFTRVPPILERFSQASKLRGTFAMLARSYEEMGLLNEALRIWEQKLKNFPDDVDNTRGNIGRLKEKLAKG
jgi:tetratricopeptide (TPR) repeat protein